MREHAAAELGHMFEGLDSDEEEDGDNGEQDEGDSGEDEEVSGDENMEFEGKGSFLSCLGFIDL